MLPRSLLAHTRARQLLQWLLPAMGRFPREHRHTVTEHMAKLAMQVHDALIAARHVSAELRWQAIARADIALDQLRQYGLLACEWHWWSLGQYEHFSRLTAELGRLIGGWKRTLKR